MSTLTTAAGFARTASRSAVRGPAVVQLLLSAVHYVIRKREEQRALAELEQLDDAVLRDIGLTRGQLRAAVRGEIHR